MTRLLAPYARVTIADRTFESGDGLLRHVSVQLGEDKRASSCRFEILDPGLKISAEFFEMSFEAGGIAVPAELLSDPDASGGAEQITVGPNGEFIPVGDAGGGAKSAVQAAELSAEEKAFLDVIAFAEGTSGPNGYTTMFTGAQFSDFSRHPNIVNRGSGISSTAAGRYQFLNTTWAGLGLPDFTPANQDRGAIELVRQRGALRDVNARDFDAAIAKTNREWASFPGAPYGQPTKTIAELRVVWERGLAQYSTGAAPISSPQQATDTTAAAPPREVSNKGTEIIVSLGFSPDQLTSYHFIHVGTHTQGRILDNTVFEGQSIRWLMTRRNQNATYENITLRDLAETIAIRYGLSLEMEGDGPTYQHLDQTGITDYQLLLRECNAIGYRVTDDQAVLKIGPIRPEFTGFVIQAPFLVPGSLSISDRASKDMPANSGQPPAAAEQKTELNRETGTVDVVVPEDGVGAGSAGGVATVTGGATPPLQGNPAPPSRPGSVAGSEVTGLPTQQIGTIDLQDGQAEAEEIQDESRRVRGYESRCELITHPAMLSLAPGQIIGIDSEIVPPVFAREWRLGMVRHVWAIGSAFRSELEFYSPQRQRAASGNSGGNEQITVGPDGEFTRVDELSLNPGGFTCPVQSGTFGSGVGYRAQFGRNHNGVDIAAPTGTPVIAPSDGVVERVVSGCVVGARSCGGGWGNYVSIAHANGIYSLVAHLSSISVSAGQNVTQGTVVGAVGSTGFSTGPHLHFEIRKGGPAPSGGVLAPGDVGMVYPGITGSQRAGFRY
jgi:muramidase (phage lysozyme)